MGGKAATPAAPDYTALAASSTQAAQIDAQTSAAQLAWAKQQYAQQQPYVQAYENAATTNENLQNQQAALSQQQYQDVYQPLETKFANEAQNYDSAAQSAQNSAAAQADVASAFAGQRSAALSSLEGYGIDPSQTRSQAMDIGTRVSQAAAMAGAGTQSRLQTQATGLGLESTAIGQGMGVAGNATSNFAGAGSSGMAGLNAGMSSASTYGNLMGTASQWAGAGNSAMGTGASIASSQGQYGLGVMQNNNAQIAGIGQLVGGIGMAAALHSDVRLKENIRRVGETHGGLPVYTYRYKGLPTVYMGVMAQEAAKRQPGTAGIMPSGYLGVDYSKIR